MPEVAPTISAKEAPAPPEEPVTPRVNSLVASAGTPTVSSPEPQKPQARRPVQPEPPDPKMVDPSPGSTPIPAPKSLSEHTAAKAAGRSKGRRVAVMLMIPLVLAGEASGWPSGKAPLRSINSPRRQLSRPHGHPPPRHWWLKHPQPTFQRVTPGGPPLLPTQRTRTSAHRPPRWTWNWPKTRRLTPRQ